MLLKHWAYDLTDLVSAVDYSASVGEVVTISCPCSPEIECTENNGRIFNWSKSHDLSTDSVFEPLFYVRRAFEMKVQSARDGGYYRCFCSDRTDVIWFVKLKGKMLSTISVVCY